MEPKLNITSDSLTTTQLLVGLHEADNKAAWEEFDARYRPILVAFLRRTGLSDADASDVAQDTMACFVRDYRNGKYQRESGRLRSWLIGIARCRLMDLRRAVGRRRERRGESAIEHLPDEQSAEEIWEAEERRIIFEHAFAELKQTARFRTQTLEAFDRVVMRHEPIATVSAELGLTPQEIYNSKNRVVERLREIVKRYEAAYLGD